MPGTDRIRCPPAHSDCAGGANRPARQSAQNDLVATGVEGDARGPPYLRTTRSGLRTQLRRGYQLRWAASQDPGGPRDIGYR
ncbi:hypothetical protein [Nocardia flavorosea]|uniref:Uncharacterized protein n=1 Tax=Nocardia flavorosea TaxID=53429 RepID=A0A846Y692_9NOCA|nr:hypothetical protein [Nocardia flavorosea]NKY54723.1 hypothetical protein [Nocardia flavorosea]